VALWIAENCQDVTVRVFENTYDPHDTAEDMFPFSEIELGTPENLVDFLKGIQYTDSEIRSFLSGHE
jgi:hypothetical protein